MPLAACAALQDTANGIRMTIAFISHPDCAAYAGEAGHPDLPARLGAIQDHLLATGLDLALRHYDAPLATREQLCRAHTCGYVDAVLTGGVAGEDTLSSPQLLHAARRAAGAAVLGVDLVLAGHSTSAFCSVRPPGHHAERDRGAGFCVFNNLAVGVLHALRTHGLERVAVVDFDAHFGNGTDAILGGMPEVLYCSLFQYPFYPYVLPEQDDARAVHIRLPANSDGGRVRAEVTAHWLPRLEAFRPELIMISAGFDAHAEDDMADLLLHERDFAWMTQQLHACAGRHAQGRIVSVLEGGYVLSALGRSAAAHLKALLG